MTDRSDFNVVELLPDAAQGEIVIAENIRYADYLIQFAGQHTEWLVGKVIRKDMNNAKHQTLLTFLLTLLNLYLGFKRAGKVYPEGISMKISDVVPAREPDIVVLLTKNLPKLQDTFLDGAADFVLEIVSPESIERDYEKKLLEYERAGVPEYWIVDPLRPALTAYELDEHGKYQQILPDENGLVASKILPGFALHPVILWQDELPAGADLLALVEKMIAQNP
jgi:Uma2 family endonuclease